MVLNLFTVNILLEIFRFNITATSVFSDFKFLSLNRVTKLFCSNRWCSRSSAHYECRIPKGSPAFWGLQKTPQVLDNMHRFWYVLLWFTRVKKERKEKRSHFTLLWWSVEVSCCCCSKGATGVIPLAVNCTNRPFKKSELQFCWVKFQNFLLFACFLCVWLCVMHQ